MKPVLLIDFGSTYTKVTAVDLEGERLLGTADSYTTVQTDVGEGLENALRKLEKVTGHLEYEARYACSSAAGGLRMITSGLVPELTAEAARQASLGAGAKVLKVYSFQLTEDDVDEILSINPDIFLLVGGTDGGNSECILHNAKILASAQFDFPVVIAGNRSAARECARILDGHEVHICENVMPKFGVLNTEPTRLKIREIFLNRIIQAKGLSKAASLIQGILMPTPSAVMKAMQLLAEGCEGEAGIGDLIVTCASMHSRNRRAGILIGKGYSMEEAMKEVKMVVEGVYSAKAAIALSKKYQVPMPIVEQVNDVLFNGKTAKEAVQDLMLRDKRIEHSDLPWEE